jgi:hypothetical protein
MNRTHIDVDTFLNYRSSRRVGRSFQSPLHIEEEIVSQAHDPSLESIICHEMTSLAPCTFEELLRRLPAHSWAHVFGSVDRFSRYGRLTVSRTRCFGYVISMGPDPPPSLLCQAGSSRYCPAGGADPIFVGSTCSSVWKEGMMQVCERACSVHGPV